MTLTIENANAEFTKIVKEIAKLFPEIKLKKHKSGIEEGLADIKAGRVTRCKDFDEFRRQMLS